MGTKTGAGDALTAPLAAADNVFMQTHTRRAHLAASFGNKKQPAGPSLALVMLLCGLFVIDRSAVNH